MTPLEEAERAMGFDTNECDVCGHQGPDVELYPCTVPVVGSFDMPLCRKCARLGTDGDTDA